MDIYFAGGGGINPQSPPGHYLLTHNGGVLCSQLNDRQAINKWIVYLKEHPDEYIRLFIDSGSFSAWTKGKTIDVDNYIDYINENHEYFTVYAAVDTIPGVKGAKPADYAEVKKSSDLTWENYLHMREKVIDKDKLLFTFHVGEDFEILKKALNYTDKYGKIAYMALGGLVGKNKDTQLSFLSKAFEIIRNSNNPNVKIHLFGLTSGPLLKQFPATSCDSTRVVKDAATGQVFLEGKTHVLSDVRVFIDGNVMNKNPHVKTEFAAKCKALGYEMEDLLHDAKLRLQFNVQTMHEFVTQLESKENTLDKTSLF